ncbi:Uncharacterised protein [Shewanella morhuae]|uniref:Winged helix-turn helix domain-containing protein n=1 Tax=Shewanella morhuae TaxID=365591 RepID=A0A379ZLS1_9GAMM|nr:Uncharacterised protein [Shewanella morhuae]
MTSLIHLAQQASLKALIQQPSLSRQGGRLMAEDLHHFIQPEFWVTFKQANIYRLLHQLGFHGSPLALATRKIGGCASNF